MTKRDVGGKWVEVDKVIRFPVTSNGMSGGEWIDFFTAKGVDVPPRTAALLRSSAFKPTSGVTTDVRVLRGTAFEHSERTSSTLRQTAARRRLVVPRPEVACLIRDQFSNEEIKEMKLTSLMVMHDPLMGLQGKPHLMYLHARNGEVLDAHQDNPSRLLGENGGFAFAEQSGF